MKKNGLNTNYLRPSNRSLTLQLLFSHGTLSRTDIADFLNITTAAVTMIVNEFLSEGLLVQKEDFFPESLPRAGRRRAPLAIQYDWRYVLAIDIHSYYINIALTNLKGDILFEHPSLTPATNEPRTLCSNIAKECIKMLWEASISTEQILGAGITIIGPVNQDEGIALHPFRLFEYPIPIKQYFEEEFPFPVAVESNVCAFLLSELLYTDIATKAQNILMLKWGPGVGSAMAIRGQVYKGYNYQSTEIGHNQIAEKNGKKCNCGRTGCLEPSISADAIVEFIEKNTAMSPAGELSKLKESIGVPSRGNLSRYLDLASDTCVLWDFLTSCAHALASVTNNAIHILAPDKLVLMGDLFEHDSIVKLFTEQLYQINPLLPPDLCIKNQPFSSKKYIGATAIAVSRLLLPL
ncbi:MAG: ROK family transcriptional regulator [Lachnospiraceae bacterium]|jgi:transcriptional regulator of PTS gene|nr:ROK family transcriptional regulator [Lachnospiraceae bacterium]